MSGAKALTILRWIGVAIGAALLTLECFDAIVTPRPDWFWLGAGALLIFLCRPRKRLTPITID
ncbi:MAG: hypothetical protein JF608_11830 [Sphingomonadales bacterium]|nr:hypothetical protein [Sphingomonadales bacterium]